MSAWLLGYLIGAGVTLIFLILFEQYDGWHGLSGGCSLTETAIHIFLATMLWPLFVLLLISWGIECNKEKKTRALEQRVAELEESRENE